MAINKFLKFFLFFAPILQNPVLASATQTSSISRIKLPEDCKDLEHVKGNPLLSKTDIFGDIHDDEECHAAIAKCTVALSKDISTDDIVGFMEGVPEDMQTTCSASTTFFKTPFTDCRGSARPAEEQLPKLTMAHKNTALDILMKVISKNTKPYNPNDVAAEKKHKESLIAALKKEIDFQEKNLAEEKKLEMQEFKKYKQKHPQATSDKYYSSKRTIIATRQFFLEAATPALTQLEQGVPPMEVISIIEKDQKNHNTKHINENVKNPQTVANSNDNLVKNIKKNHKSKKKVATVIGKNHMRKMNLADFPQSTMMQPGTQAYIQFYIEIQNNIVKKFYEDLDQFADENPYSVFLCKNKTANATPKFKR